MEHAREISVFGSLWSVQAARMIARELAAGSCAGEAGSSHDQENNQGDRTVDVTELGAEWPSGTHPLYRSDIPAPDVSGIDDRLAVVLLLSTDQVVHGPAARAQMQTLTRAIGTDFDRAIVLVDHPLGAALAAQLKIPTTRVSVEYGQDADWHFAVTRNTLERVSFAGQGPNSGFLRGSVGAYGRHTAAAAAMALLASYAADTWSAQDTQRQPRDRGPIALFGAPVSNFVGSVRAHVYDCREMLERAFEEYDLVSEQQVRTVCMVDDRVHAWAEACGAILSLNSSDVTLTPGARIAPEVFQQLCSRIANGAQTTGRKTRVRVKENISVAISESGQTGSCESDTLVFIPVAESESSFIFGADALPAEYSRARSADAERASSETRSQQLPDSPGRFESEDAS